MVFLPSSFSRNFYCFFQCISVDLTMMLVIASTLLALALAAEDIPFICIGNDCGVNSKCVAHENGYRCVCNENYLSSNTPRNGKDCEGSASFTPVSFPICSNRLTLAINLCKRAHDGCGEHSTCHYDGPKQVLLLVILI